MIKCDELEKCFSKSSDKKKTLIDKKGGKSKLVIENPSKKEFKILDVENCVYKDFENDTKCDFALIIDKRIIYIELKGSNVKQGFSQLKSTIEDTKHCFKDFIFEGRIVVTKFSKPDFARQNKDYIDLVKLLKKAPIIKQHVYSENL